MTLLEQLNAEKRARAHAVNEAQRLEVDPNRYRSDADRTRLAETDTLRTRAEAALNAAGMEQADANRIVNHLSSEDWASTFWRDLSSSKVTPAARDALQRATSAKDGVDAAREKLQKAVRAHNAAVREIDAVAAAKRRAAKLEAGQLTTVAEGAPARQASTGRASRYTAPVKP